MNDQLAAGAPGKRWGARRSSANHSGPPWAGRRSRACGRVFSDLGEFSTGRAEDGCSIPAAGYAVSQCSASIAPEYN